MIEQILEDIASYHKAIQALKYNELIDEYTRDVNIARWEVRILELYKQLDNFGGV